MHRVVARVSGEVLADFSRTMAGHNELDPWILEHASQYLPHGGEPRAVYVLSPAARGGGGGMPIPPAPDGGNKRTAEPSGMALSPLANRGSLRQGKPRQKSLEGDHPRIVHPDRFFGEHARAAEAVGLAPEFV